MLEVSNPAAIRQGYENWVRVPSTDRPMYECPICGEQALQFFHVLSETSQSAQRDDSFICCACGRSWEM